MSAADAILAGCKKVRATGNGSWIACCPAHEDKNPSMTVREMPDGMVLVHCFAGCSVELICGATGVKVEELFPEPLPERRPLQRLARPFSANDVLDCLANEASVIFVIGSDMIHKREISDGDFERLKVAVERVKYAEDIALGRY